MSIPTKTSWGIDRTLFSALVPEQNHSSQQLARTTPSPSFCRHVYDTYNVLTYHVIFTSRDSQILNNASPRAFPPCSMVVSMFGCSTPQFLLVKQCQTYSQPLIFGTSLPHHLPHTCNQSYEYIVKLCQTCILNQSLPGEYETTQFRLRKIHHLPTARRQASMWRPPEAAWWWPHGAGGRRPAGFGQHLLDQLLALLGFAIALAFRETMSGQGTI